MLASYRCGVLIHSNPPGDIGVGQSPRRGPQYVQLAGRQHERERLHGHPPRPLIKIDANRTGQNPPAPQPRGQNIIRPPGTTQVPQRRRSAHHRPPCRQAPGRTCESCGPAAHDSLNPPRIASYGAIYLTAEHHVRPTPNGGYVRGYQALFVPLAVPSSPGYSLWTAIWPYVYASPRLGRMSASAAGSTRARPRWAELAGALITGTIKQVTNRAMVSRWLTGYEAAWRASGTGRLVGLFTGDATYLKSPYEQPITGLEVISRMWEEEREGPDEVFTLATDILAVDGPTAVVRAEVRYGDPLRQEYRDLWVIRLADDGRCTWFEEWPYWPGRPYSAHDDLT